LIGMALVIPVFIPHRGCPHHCLFCNQEKIAGIGRGDGASPAIAATIDEWLGRSPGHDEVQVAFYGGSFTCLPAAEQQAMLAAVRPYIEARRVACIRLSTRPDCIDAEICRMLAEFRVGVVELGVQSLSDHVLKVSERGHDAGQCRTAIALLQDAGFQTGVQLMPGLPGETRRSFLHGIDEVIGLKPDFVRLYPVLVVKDSGLESLYRQKRYRPLSLNEAVALTARAYRKLNDAGIQVVRMGLQPSASLAASLVAGPFHPAFGELVRARLWLQRMRAGLAGLKAGEKLSIHVSHRDRSAVMGMGKQNFRRLEELGFAGRFTIVSDTSMERGSIRYVVC
jgi:histone acetyltransferase (RNA polymerase elongator complex component)